MRYYSKRHKRSRSFCLRENGYLERRRIKVMRIKSRLWVKHFRGNPPHVFGDWLLWE